MLLPADKQPGVWRLYCPQQHRPLHVHSISTGLQGWGARP
jgi:hypothetical protein